MTEIIPVSNLFSNGILGLSFDELNKSFLLQLQFPSRRYATHQNSGKYTKLQRLNWLTIEKAIGNCSTRHNCFVA